MEEPDKFRYDVKLTDTETCKVFFDKLTFIYLEMPKFNKTADSLESHFDKWMYVIRNLNKLDRVPNQLGESIFERLFEVAEIAKFSKEEADAYEESLKSYRDLKNSLDTAFEEGMEKGREEEKREIIKKLIGIGLDVASISTATGYSEHQIKEIVKDLNKK